MGIWIFKYGKNIIINSENVYSSEDRDIKTGILSDSLNIFKQGLSSD